MINEINEIIGQLNMEEENVEDFNEGIENLCPVCQSALDSTKKCECGYDENEIFVCPYLNTENNKRICNFDNQDCPFYGLDYEGCEKYQNQYSD
jgi:hypothetical protein